MPAIKNFLIDLVWRRPAQRRSLSDWVVALAKGGEQLQQKLDHAADTPKNREQLRHIITIERWGQRRLQTFLGEPATTDESDDYQPSADQGWAALREMMRETRRETIALGQRIVDIGLTDTVTVDHNQFGPLSARAWLRYLALHARTESWRIR